MKRRLAALALALALLLPGCATTQSQINAYNATLYVRGLLCETYTGLSDAGYQTLTGTGDSDAREAFEKNLKAEYAQRLAIRFELEDKYLTARQRDKFYDLLEQVYAHVTFSVQAAVALNNGRWCVEVTVTPVTFFHAAYADGYSKLRADFDREHPLPGGQELLDLSAGELREVYQDYHRAWADAVYYYLLGRLDAVTTGPAVTKLLLVAPASDGLYTVSPTDLQDLDDCVLAY